MQKKYVIQFPYGFSVWSPKFDLDVTKCTRRMCLVDPKYFSILYVLLRISAHDLLIECLFLPHTSLFLQILVDKERILVKVAGYSNRGNL